MKKKPYRRRRYFLPHTSQPRLLLAAISIFVVLMLITGAILLLIANRDLTESYFSAHLAIKNVQQLLLPALVLANLGGLLLGTALLVLYTHRVAGPAYRLCLILKQVGEGDLRQKVTFRRGDSLQELAAAANVMIDGARLRIAQLQRQLAQLQAAWEQLEGQIPAGRAREQAADAIAGLESVLAQYRIGQEEKDHL